MLYLIDVTKEEKGALEWSDTYIVEADLFMEALRKIYKPYLAYDRAKIRIRAMEDCKNGVHVENGGEIRFTVKNGKVERE